jgi:hypothetical protein
MCGDVLSSRAPTALGMVLQCSGWWYNGGDGHTGPEVMGETRSTGPTSRRLLTVKIRQPSHEFTFGVGMSFIPYPLVLTPVV